MVAVPTDLERHPSPYKICPLGIAKPRPILSEILLTTVIIIVFRLYKVRRIHSFWWLSRRNNGDKRGMKKKKAPVLCQRKKRLRMEYWIFPKNMDKRDYQVLLWRPVCGNRYHRWRN